MIIKPSTARNSDNNWTSGENAPAEIYYSISDDVYYQSYFRTLSDSQSIIYSSHSYKFLNNVICLNLYLFFLWKMLSIYTNIVLS